ncbi:NAF1-domain-containing protein [Neolentinus lepideus HHB14362 ss-1]|uniref:H/ACA ribonucleoprotein complex non-core subunit NAF1 n=1 Tax=Neolentinus lepideus HHB14362 ss-1 TaxID=1314782 RepID=A0A165W7A6_9AGAM|nr:NAF1-domain-containing protein [Neolentinus lepideus HHB14362 ss-1]
MMWTTGHPKRESAVSSAWTCCELSIRSGVSRAVTEPHSSDSESDADDSDTDTEPGDDNGASKTQEQEPAGEDDEFGDSGPANSVVKTEHEVTDYNITIPDISEVGPEEELEHVGRIMNVGDNVVIVQGTAAQDSLKAQQRALDSETLLVFEDRKVLGYIHDTFGPTHQPLYQVRFNQAYPIDLTKVEVSSPVFHVPRRSKFIFVNELKLLKGSDASNAHDEEPGEEEMEFSDDEQEAEHKRRLKQKRLEARGQSLPPSSASRPATPTPQQMHDQDLGAADLSYGSNPYDEYSPYNVDSSSSQARVAPLPYDDPYSDTYDMNMVPSQSQSVAAKKEEEGTFGIPPSSSHSQQGSRGRGRGRGQNTKFGREINGRGRGSRRDKPNRGRGRGRQSGPQDGARDLQHHQSYAPQGDQEYNPRMPRSASPASLAIARATGQYANGTSSAPQNAYSSNASNNYWSYQQQASSYQGNNAAYGYQQSFVQPHINPRFASAYGYQFNGVQPDQYGQYGSYGSGSGQGNIGNGGWRGYGGSYNPSDT